MNKVDLLIEGYAKVTDSGPASTSEESTLGGWKASSTSCLITAQKDLTPNPLLKGEGEKGVVKILTDPGANRKLLLERLDTVGIQTSDIEYVFLSHLHLDHSLLMGIFENAKIINHEAITDGENGTLVPAMIPGTDISIIKTPGHEYAGASLLVPTEEGTVGIVGDVFWFEEGEEPSFAQASDGKAKIDIEKPDDFAADMEVLKESRKKVLELCDFIVPGHGKMMRISK